MKYIKYCKNKFKQHENPENYLKKKNIYIQTWGRSFMPTLAVKKDRVRRLVICRAKAAL